MSQSPGFVHDHCPRTVVNNEATKIVQNFYHTPDSRASEQSKTKDQQTICDHCPHIVVNNKAKLLEQNFYSIPDSTATEQNKTSYQPTILDVLTSGRRQPDSSELKNGRNTDNPNFAITEEIEVWEEFTFENVMLAFGPYLLMEAPDSMGPQSLSESSLFTINEASLTTIFREYTLETVTPAAKATVNDSTYYPPSNLETPETMLHYQEFVLKKSYITESYHKYVGKDITVTPDWVVVRPPPELWSFINSESSRITQNHKAARGKAKAQYTHEKFKAKLLDSLEVLLVGESKRSVNWTFQKSKDKLEQLKKTPNKPESSAAKLQCKNASSSEKCSEKDGRNMLRPIDQTSTYCLWANVPLGCLHSEEELLICNTRLIGGRDRGDGKPRTGVKVVRVVWQETYAPDTLTPELALYCATIAAHNSRARHTYSVGETYLNEDLIIWYRIADFNDSKDTHAVDGNTRYRNKMSGAERPYSELKEHLHLKLLEREV
ncbi:hypothetical protein PFICI_02425 [Pestalotiopsis fici W106-1]|uniref:Uncharacterized protein n=1 Tax=Pestalotiopsis fici (strain W106-1 / CGMCC3.15140) TaxID=1229662 RepID=W3XEC2_PESFW|nr:uncharacterized protein PFICI_02425 [Pestalotiopsis fici W106-1]ETS84400.1 hypothetical protein PFICI_02425 [Pestalotiopsis fici W106-1]